ncbi:MAG: hypothetical protein NTU63_00190 [Candidatus Pacearchaeota archaeon]|nr:hypothetical protein [Candidatus Pacearchaeota archaeon]
MVKKFIYKKGLSTIVTTLILIVISMSAIALIWTVVNNMIHTTTEQTEACFGSYDKVKLNAIYTCYEQIDSLNYRVRFSLSIGDATIDKVVIGIASQGAIKSYKLNNTLQTFPDLQYYPSGTQVKLPDKNAGLTYVASGFASKPDLIQIAPVISEKQCEISDSLTEIENCAGLI